MHAQAQWWDTLNWGTVPDWFVAGGTIAAFLIAAIAYIWNVSISRSQQARKVAIGDLLIRTYAPGQAFDLPVPSMLASGDLVALHPPRLSVAVQRPLALVQITVHNGSDEVMGPVEIALHDRMSGSFMSDAVYILSRVQAGAETTVHIGLADQWHPAHPALNARIVFRDSVGRWWQRFENESVRPASRHVQPGWPQRDLADDVARVPADPNRPPVATSGRWLPVGKNAYISVDGTARRTRK